MKNAIRSTVSALFISAIAIGGNARAQTINLEALLPEPECAQKPLLEQLAKADKLQLVAQGKKPNDKGSDTNVYLYANPATGEWIVFAEPIIGILCGIRAGDTGFPGDIREKDWFREWFKGTNHARAAAAPSPAA